MSKAKNWSKIRIKSIIKNNNLGPQFLFSSVILENESLYSKIIFLHRENTCVHCYPNTSIKIYLCCATSRRKGSVETNQESSLVTLL